MKISAQDEYGLRLLIRIAGAGKEGLSIAQLSDLEGLSVSYAAKITRALRLAGFIQSTRGPRGGYVLALPKEKIIIGEVIKAMGGELFDPTFCQDHSGAMKICVNSVDCSLRSLWKVLQVAVDRVLGQVTLADLMSGEQAASTKLQIILDHINFPEFAPGAPTQ